MVNILVINRELAVTKYFCKEFAVIARRQS